MAVNYKLPKKSGPWFSKLSNDLNSRDTVVSEPVPKEAPNVMDLSHLRPKAKPVRGDQF